MGVSITKACIFIVLAVQFSISTALISSPDVNSLYPKAFSVSILVIICYLMFRFKWVFVFMLN